MESRTDKSLKNSMYAAFANVANMLITFLSRTVFIIILNEDYLGLNGLFSNVLSILSLAELGVGTAIVYNLYKPLAKRDIETLKSLVNFYKYIYLIIGSSILLLGFVISFFITNFMESVPNIQNIQLIFFVFVLNSSVSYFFSYRTVLISADQKQFIVSKWKLIMLVVQNILQIIILFKTKNYILYLIIQLFCTIIQNVILSIIAVKIYPFIKEKNINKLDCSISRNIKKNTYALIFHKIGSTVVSSTDNLLISKFISVATVGIYSNYTLIVNSIITLLSQVFSSITASVGNLINTTDNEHINITFFRIFFLNFWIYGWASICLFCLLNPFIQIWIGKNMLLEQSTVSIITINFFLMGIRRTVLIFRDANGLYWQDRYKPVLESFMNLLASLLLVKYLGIDGIFIGTTISTICSSLWIEPIMLFRNTFSNYKKPVVNYFKSLTLYLLLTISMCILTYMVINILGDHGLMFFILKVLICVFFPNIIFIILFFKNVNFKWATQTIKNRIFKF